MHEKLWTALATNERKGVAQFAAFSRSRNRKCSISNRRAAKSADRLPPRT